jgi:hypothetical protein
MDEAKMNEWIDAVLQLWKWNEPRFALWVPNQKQALSGPKRNIFPNRGSTNT